MVTLHFDNHGFLKPYQPISVDLETLEYYFCDQFPQSETRKNLFIKYLRYLERFKSRVSRNFTQWIDGSFTSLKQNPKDIDFVVFLDYEIYEREEQFLDQYWGFGLEDKGIKGLDAFLEKYYPPEHPSHAVYLSARQYWQEVFSDKIQNEVVFPKGFLEIKFEG